MTCRCEEPTEGMNAADDNWPGETLQVGRVTPTHEDIIANIPYIALLIGLALIILAAALRTAVWIFTA